MGMPQCCYLAKGAKRPSHTTNTIKFDRIPFDPCNSIKRFDHCPFDQKNSTYLQPPNLNQSLSPLYDLICFMQPSIVYDFVAELYSLYLLRYPFSIRQKRKRRLNFPIYYSSHTIHLLNQKDTNICKMFRFWSLQLALEQRELDLTPSQSFE